MSAKLCLAVVLAAVLISHTSAQTASLSRQAIMDRVVSMMRSRAYWLSLDFAFFGHYQVGKIVEVSLVRHANEAAVFMHSAGANFILENHDSGDITGKYAGVIVHGTNDTAVTSYFNSDCILMPMPQRTAEGNIVITPHSDCPDPNKQPPSRENFMFTLPPSPPPDYVLKRTRPSDLEYFQTLVTAAVRNELRFARSRCTSAEVFIPYYSREDRTSTYWSAAEKVVSRLRGCSSFSRYSEADGPKTN